jgi:hypothetical protein
MLKINKDTNLPFHYKKNLSLVEILKETKTMIQVQPTIITI